MRFAVIDTETTGLDPENNKLIEIASVWNDGQYFHSLVSPNGTQVEFGAMAVHHITNEMVANAPNELQAYDAVWLGQTQTTDGPILVMHNAQFDRDFLSDHLKELRWVCTYRCALHLVPDAQSHKNGALWYELGLNHEMPPEAGQMPHRALFDALMTFDILVHFLELAGEFLQRKGHHDTPEARIEYLIYLSTAPAILKKCGFGKHAGELWADVPTDYMNWVLGKDFNEDVKHTCRYWIEARSN